MKTKKELRQEALQTLQQLSPKTRADYSASIQKKILSSDVWATSHVIGVTISQGVEWDTHQLIKTAWSQNKKVAVPKVNPQKKSMDFYIINDFDQLEESFYDLLEPKVEETVHIDHDTIELLLVPGLIFNRQGYRIGFGGGYYDRMLTAFKGVTLSQLSSKQWNNHWEPEEWDQSVDILVSEEEWLEI